MEVEKRSLQTSPKKVVLFITREIVPFYYGGIGTLFMSVARFFASAGHKVFFLTEKREDFCQQRVSEYYKDIEFLFVDCPPESDFVDYSPSGGVVGTFKLKYAYSVADKFQDCFNKISPDLVISADFGAEAYILMIRHKLGEFSGTRFILHISGALREIMKVYHAGVEAQNNALREPQNRLVCSMEDTCVLLADEIIAPTDIAWEEVNRRLKRGNKNVQVIPNLISPELAGAGVGLDRKKERAGRKTILFIGRLDRHKGADRLLNLFINYKIRYPSEAHLIIIGRDCFSKEYGSTFLEEWSAKIPDNIKDSITFTGQVEPDAVAGYLEKSSVCVFPSRWEVFGNVCLEAMSHGVPSIVAANTGLVEVLGDGFPGLVFDFDDDPDALPAKLHELLSKDDHLTVLSGRLQNRAVQVIDEAGNGYKNLVERDPGWAGSDDHRDLPVNKLLTALRASSDINHYLGNDFKILSKYYNVSDKQAKKIIQGKSSGDPGLIARIRTIFQ